MGKIIGRRHSTDLAAGDLSLADKLALFDQNTARLSKLQAAQIKKAAKSRNKRKDRGWTRADLYVRGFHD